MTVLELKTSSFFSITANQTVFASRTDFVRDVFYGVKYECLYKSGQKL